MADYSVSVGVNTTAAPKVTSPIAKSGNEEWLSEDIIVKLASSDKIAPIVVDFSYTVASVVEYTLDGGVTFVAFNNNNAVAGGQSRFIRVTTDVQLNFRATQAGTLNRCIVSIP